MGQARIDTDPYTIPDANPADLLTQIDCEYQALVVKVFCAAVATAVVMLSAEQVNQTRRGVPQAHAALHLQAPMRADHATTASPIVGSASNEVRDIPDITRSLAYAYVHIHAR